MKQAAGIVAASDGKVKIVDSMKLVGFSTPERRNMTTYQQVRRRASKLIVVEVPKKPLPAQVNLSSSASHVSALSTSEETGRGRKRLHSVVVPRRQHLDDTPASTEGDTPASNEGNTTTNTSSSNSSKDATTTPIKGKKARKTSKELQRSNAKAVAMNKVEKEAMKQATLKVHRNRQLPANHPDRLTTAIIVSQTNLAMNSNISAKTVADYVRKNLIGVSPLKRGPVGHFIPRIYSALKGAFCTYLKLEQAGSTKQSTLKQMSQLVNACVNKAGHTRTRDDLARKLKRDTADQFVVAKANVVDHRRLMWTTAYNLNVWFDTFKDTLIDLGFGRVKNPGEDAEGEVVFFEGQKRRIINLDETDGSLDDTTGQRGGRPPMTFLAQDVSGGGTAVNKSGYSSTVICGSNAAGEPLPPHFQLKTTAQNELNQRIGVDWIANAKNVVAQFGFPVRCVLPCTFGMNEKAGMNAVELDKYFTGSILPLYPDVEDKAGKRVLVKVDSGPGRMNVEMLAKLQVRGLYLVPGVPNSTATTQETDQNYGIYKSVLRDNLRLLSQARFEKKLSMHVSDLPLLVFGGRCASTGTELRDSFSLAFSIERNIACWKKCGAVPLTRSPLHSEEVRHEVPTGPAALLTVTNPAIDHLKNLEDLNDFYCTFLSSNGFDGNQLRKEAPKRTTYVAVTEPHSLERIRALKKAKTAGQMFYATGGRHINSEEFFKSKTLLEWDEALKQMEEEKEKRAKYAVEQRGAVEIIRNKGDLTSINDKLFTAKEIKTLLKWKKVKPKGTKKADLVEAYIAAAKPPIQKSWTRSEEAALEDLKSEHVDLKDTALGIATTQMARAVANNLAQLDPESRDVLIKTLQAYDEDNGPNVL